MHRWNLKLEGEKLEELEVRTKVRRENKVKLMSYL